LCIRGDFRAAPLDGPYLCGNPSAVAVVESALIFEVERDARARGESETVLSTGVVVWTALSWSPRPTS